MFAFESLSFSLVEFSSFPGTLGGNGHGHSILTILMVHFAPPGVGGYDHCREEASSKNKQAYFFSERGQFCFFYIYIYIYIITCFVAALSSSSNAGVVPLILSNVFKGDKNPICRVYEENAQISLR